MHRYILHNDEIREAAEECISPGQVGMLSGWGVFSTLRVARGVLFAYERHYARMRRDAVLMRVPFPADPAFIEQRLLRLREANALSDATLRVAVVRNKGGIWQGPGVERDFDLIGLTTDLNQWGEGVRLSVVPQARHAESRFAGTKILSWAANLTWYEEAQEQGFDEAVLLNERGEVSECTSANIFITEGRNVWTPPLSSGCLPGVTRDLLLTEVRADGIRVAERPLSLEDLERADEVFITSTTRNLLPVLEIEGLKVRRNGHACAALNTAFVEYIDRYVRSKVDLDRATVLA
ncbi:MAG: aminotransferase class IV [Bryobacteraceae bacterium]